MTTAPEKSKRKEDKDNIFLEILHALLIQIPVVVIGWIISQFTSER